MLEQTRAAWDNLQPRQRAILAIVLVGTILGLITVGVWSSKPSYSVLYSGLAPEAASGVVDELRSGKVPYTLADGGTAIMVPSSSLYETRLTLAAKGMPASSGVGFELFDRSTLPGTDFSNGVNLQRALQGELSRTIASLNEIRSARVHLSMRRESLYVEPTPPRASVMLDLGANGQLKQDQVLGIAYLVASAVESLDFRDVTIVDTRGQVLHGSGGDDSIYFSETALSTEKAYNEALTARLQSMLNAMFGPNQTIVRAQAELDLDTEETQQELLEPLPETGGQPVVSREHTSSEVYSPSEGGGIGGIASSITVGTPADVGNGKYDNREETREYEFSKTLTVRRRRPGTVTRLNVAAVVDEALPAADVTRVTEVLSAAAGIDTTRGDTIVVRQMKIIAAESAQEEAKQLELQQVAQLRQNTVSMLLRRGLPLLVVVVLLVIGLRTATEIRKAVAGAGEAPSSEPNPQAQAYSGPAMTPFMQAPEDEQAAEALPAAMPARATEHAATPRTNSEEVTQQQEEQALTEELRRIANEQPDLLAQELRNLVSGSDGI